MYIVYCILYIDIGDEINNSIIYFVQTNYYSCCSYLKYHFTKYLIFNAHRINIRTLNDNQIRKLTGYTPHLHCNCQGMQNGCNNYV